MEKIKKLLDKACIDYKVAQDGMIMLDTAPVFLRETKDGILISGAGYNGIWSYGPEYVVRMLDRKFREGMGVKNERYQ